jgi:hypothetical protein
MLEWPFVWNGTVKLAQVYKLANNSDALWRELNDCAAIFVFQNSCLPQWSLLRAKAENEPLPDTLNREEIALGR